MAVWLEELIEVSLREGCIYTARLAILDHLQATPLIGGFHLSRGDQPLLDFDFSELGLCIPGGKTILRGVTGTI